MKKYPILIFFISLFYFLNYFYSFSDDLSKNELCQNIFNSIDSVKNEHNKKNNLIFLNDIKLNCNLKTLIYSKTFKLEEFNYTSEVILDLQKQHNLNTCKTDLIKIFNFTIIDLIYYRNELMFFLITKPSDC